MPKKMVNSGILQGSQLFKLLIKKRSFAWRPGYDFPTWM